MYWFARPPYLRWIGAALILLAAAWIDLRPRSTILYPFTSSAIPAGAVLGEADVIRRPVPKGLLPDPPSLPATVRYAIGAGEPLLGSATDPERPSIPDGWWSIQLPVPRSVIAGQRVRLVIGAGAPGKPARAVSGIVVEPPPPEDPLAYEDPIALVAIPETDAIPIAEASTVGDIPVLVGPAP